MVPPPQPPPLSLPDPSLRYASMKDDPEAQHSSPHVSIDSLEQISGRSSIGESTGGISQTYCDSATTDLMNELGRLIKQVDLKHEMKTTLRGIKQNHQEMEKAKLHQIRRLVLKTFNRRPQGGHVSPSSRSIGKSQRRIFETGYLPLTYSEKLIYIACLPELPTSSPFEYYQKEAFRRARKNARRAAFLLGLPVALPVLIILCGTSSFIWLITDPIYSLSPTTGLVIVTTVSFIVTLIASLFSWYVTGIYPDKSSNAANARQNATLDLKETYDELSYEMVDLFKEHHAQARLLALLVDLPLIKYRARQAGADHWDIRKIFRLFESSLAYIREGVLPRHHLLLHYIVAPTHEGSMEKDGFRERSASIGPNITRVIRQYLPRMSSSMADYDEGEGADVLSESSNPILDAELANLGEGQGNLDGFV